MTLRVNGAPQPLVLEKGFAALSRVWRAGDRIELELPMPVRRVLCDERVEGDRGRGWRWSVALSSIAPRAWITAGKRLGLTLADAAILTPVWQADFCAGSWRCVG